MEIKLIILNFVLIILTFQHKQQHATKSNIKHHNYQKNMLLTWLE